MALVDRSAPPHLTRKVVGPDLSTRTTNETKGNAPNDLSNRKYILWDADGVEKVPPGEEEHIQAVIKQIDEIQKFQFNKARHCYGGTHARTQGVIVGKFVVPDDLPQHLKQSELFEKGGEYPVICRYSSEPGDPGLDASTHLVINIEKQCLRCRTGPHPAAQRFRYEAL